MEFRDRYNQQWIVERLGYRTPVQARRDFKVPNYRQRRDSTGSTYSHCGVRPVQSNTKNDLGEANESNDNQPMPRTLTIYQSDTALLYGSALSLGHTACEPIVGISCGPSDHADNIGVLSQHAFVEALRTSVTAAAARVSPRGLAALREGLAPCCGSPLLEEDIHDPATSSPMVCEVFGKCESVRMRQF